MDAEGHRSQQAEEGGRLYYSQIAGQPDEDVRTTRPTQLECSFPKAGTTSKYKEDKE